MATTDIVPQGAGGELGRKRIVNDMLDKAKGKKRIDVVDDYAYPLPVAVMFLYEPAYGQ